MKTKFIPRCHHQDSKVSNDSTTSSDSNSSSTSVGPICRICHEGGSKEDLVTPCRCTGSMAGVHRPCLERWLSSSNSDTCEICKYKFIIFRQPMPFFEWISRPTNHEDCRNLAGDLVCFFLLTPLAAISSFLCFTGAKSYSSWKVNWEASGLLCLSLILMGIYLTWCTITVRYHIQNWRKWRTTHLNVHLIQLKRLSELSLTTISPDYRIGNDIPLIQMPVPINTQAVHLPSGESATAHTTVVEMTHYSVNRGSNCNLLHQVSISGTPSMLQTPPARTSSAALSTVASLPMQNECLQPLLPDQLFEKHDFMDETQV